jgi:hypothetical protein
MIIWSRNPIAFPQIITVTPFHITGNPNGRRSPTCRS